MSEPRLALGTVYGDSQHLVTISPEDLLHHMLVVGQSGSGKSFMLARLIEELLLRTRGRVVIIDPNGDFRRICDVAPPAEWTKFAAMYADLAKLSEPVLDCEQPFRQAWYTRRFQYIVANPNRVSRPAPENPLVRQRDLFVHWAFVSSEEQGFLIDLLNVDPVIRTKINLGVRACNEYLERLVEEQKLPQGYGLLEVIRVADMFLAKDVNLADFPYVKGFSPEDWSIVSGNLQQLYHRHFWMWWNAEALGWNGNWDAPPRRTDMLGQLLRPFGRFVSPDVWNACVLGLDQARTDDGLLAVNLALYRLWHSAQHQWRHAEMQSDLEADRRVPTFVVVDEAHNYAPIDHRTPVQKRVTDKLIQIAAEGRKYGLYLILATQRPRKLHPHLVLECENCCLLRVQSKVEQKFLGDEFGIPTDEVGRIGKFEKGHALLHGRWVRGKQTEIKVAPARTVVGGGGIPTYWLSAPSFDVTTKPLSSEIGESQEDVAEPATDEEVESENGPVGTPAQGQHLGNRIAEVVRQSVAESLVAIPLSNLGQKVRKLFGDRLIEATEWAGSGSLSNLVKSLSDPCAVYCPVAEGFVYDPARHEEPVYESVADRVKRTHPHLAPLVERLHNQLHITLLTPSEYAVVFRALEQELRTNGYDFARTVKAVRNEARQKDVKLSRPSINFMLTRLYSKGCLTGGLNTKCALELGRAYLAALLSFEYNGFTVSQADETALSELILSELSASPSDREAKLSNDLPTSVKTPNPSRAASTS